MDERIEVGGDAPYPVVLGEGIDLAGALEGAMESGPCALLTDSEVGVHHAGAVVRALERGGWRVVSVVEVPPGERSKSLETYGRAAAALARDGLTRDGTLFALGGGVVGDLGGFLAATYMRGVGLVMLPTSLLAMVDSAVGGKTGIDLPEGKNLLGAFVRPRAVVADLAWLRTLPEREVSCGLAEVVKMGLLCGGGFFEDLALVGAARGGDMAAVRTLVARSVRFKASVVASDERERGRRAILNYGHTIGHGIEAACGYEIRHGEAVAVGMLAEADLSRERFGRDLLGLHRELVGLAGLPSRAPGVRVRDVLLAMRRDKKRTREDVHRFVLLRDVGEPVWGVEVGEEEAGRAVERVVA